MQQETKKHADASPSSSQQWLNCPASVTKARGRSRVATTYTRDGTAAHLLAEAVLKGEDAPDVFMIDGETVEITDEMIDAVEMYTDYVWEVATGAVLLIETRVHVDVEGEPLSGTADAIVYSEPDLEIVDLKYGQGVGVEPDSPQLRIYALGALEELGPFVTVTDVAMTIVQPRNGGVKTARLSVAELSAWERDILKPAIARLAADDQTEIPGDHCQWCVRAGECRALAELAAANAMVAFDELPPDPQGMSDEDLGRLLGYGEMIAQWLTAVRAEVSARIDQGRPVPGWKLVPKRAMRKWSDPDEALLVLEAHGVPLETVTRIETIGAVEKILKYYKLNPEEVIYPFTVKESSGTTLVNEGDARPAVAVTDIFDDLPQISGPR